MARLWDGIRESTERGGTVVTLPASPVAPVAAAPVAPDVAEAVGR